MVGGDQYEYFQEKDFSSRYKDMEMLAWVFKDLLSFRGKLISVNIED